MSVDEYVARLGRRLWARPLDRRRILAEVESHLRQSAQEHGEEEAIRRFGPPSQFDPDWAWRAVAVCIVGFLAAYVAGENLLPPAPWPSADAAPSFLRWTWTGTTWAFFGGVVAFALRRTRLAAALVAVAALLALAGGIRRSMLYDELGVVGRLSWLEVALGAAWLAAVAATAALASRSNGFSR